VQNHKTQSIEQVKFSPIISTDKTYIGCKYTNFITSCGIYQALLVSDRLYLKCQTNLVSVGVSEVCSPYSAQLSSHSYVSIRIS
jgi:hypothetical protein